MFNFHENLYTLGFWVADFEYAVSFSIFRMADPIWRKKISKNFKFLWKFVYKVCSENKVNFQISRAMYIGFSIFFSYVGTLVPNVCSQFHQYSIFCLFVRGIKVTSVLRMLAIFCCLKKWIKEFKRVNITYNIHFLGCNFLRNAVVIF